MDQNLDFRWKHLIHLLQCPRDEGTLSFSDGHLVCQQGHRYPVIRGIPRFVDKQFYSDSFGYEWNRWPRVQFESENIGKPMEGRTRSMFRAITGWDSNQLLGNVVVEFGCGSGRFLDIVRESGATVVGIDLSSAVEAARLNFQNDKHVLIVQGDVLRPPIRNSVFDKAYSIGVLHHTPSPATGVKAMANAVRAGGEVACRVYSARGYYHYPSVRMHRLLYQFLRRSIGNSTSQRIATSYAETVANILHPIFVTLRQIPIIGRATAHMIERLLIVHPNIPDARWRTLDIFDAITPHHASTHTSGEVISWFIAAGLHEIHRTSGETSFVAKKSEHGIPRVSVVMSVRNGGTFLREAIDSILQQSLKDIEYLIVDDGSSDETWSILSTYIDPRIQLIRHHQSRGLSSSLNEAIAHARGEYVARMDADDISYPTRLERQVTFLNQHPDIDIVGTFATLIKADGSVISVYRRPITHRLMQWSALASNPLIHPSVMARTPVLCKYQYDEEYANAQDYKLWSHLLWNTEVRFANIPEPLIRYRIHDTSTTGMRSSEKTERSLSIVLANLERYKPVPDSIRHALTRLRTHRTIPLRDACALQIFLTRLAFKFSQLEHLTINERLRVTIDLLRIMKNLTKAWIRHVGHSDASSQQA